MFNPAPQQSVGDGPQFCGRRAMLAAAIRAE